jgi:small subunit ribosomal protein S5
MDRNQKSGQRPQRNRNTNLVTEEKQFEEVTLHVDRVARVVKGGRRFRFRALVAIGDKKGKVGIGSAKGADVTLAVTKATDVAKKHLVTISLTNDTIAHDTLGKVSGSRILLIPARPGTGLIAGGVVRSILELAGVKNILSKSLGSSNKTNTAYATIEALISVVPESKWPKNHAKRLAPTPKAKPKAKTEAKTKAKG